MRGADTMTEREARDYVAGLPSALLLPGQGLVESLNVAVVAGICLHERQRARLAPDNVLR